MDRKAPLWCPAVLRCRCVRGFSGQFQKGVLRSSHRDSPYDIMLMVERVARRERGLSMSGLSMSEEENKAIHRPEARARFGIGP